MLGRGDAGCPPGCLQDCLGPHTPWGPGHLIPGKQGGGLTGQREEAQAAHAQEMLQAKILHLEKKMEWEWGRGRGGASWGAATMAPGARHRWGRVPGQGAGCRDRELGARAGCWGRVQWLSPAELTRGPHPFPASQHQVGGAPGWTQELGCPP